MVYDLTDTFDATEPHTENDSITFCVYFYPMRKETISSTKMWPVLSVSSVFFFFFYFLAF